MAEASIERWGVYEASFEGPATGNSYLEVDLRVTFRQGHRTVAVRGFYDGEGVYRARFSPDAEGEWTWTTQSNVEALDQLDGGFTCVAPSSPHNHGPVQVDDRHFRYADGTPYACIGTTSYAWAHQGDELAERTLKALAASPFDKLRMTVFPKHYRYNENEPPCYAFPCTQVGSSFWEGRPEYRGEDRKPWAFDFERFDPSFWRMFERRVAQVGELGVEADLIVFHPYDRWGFAHMPPEVEDRYLRYLVARLAAYRHVWWSLANEWDLMRDKTVEDWQRYARVIQEEDPYDRLRSIHNCHRWYDHNRPWVTHCSIQSSDPRADRLRGEYRKPLVYDEICYEGTVPEDWGNISAAELVHRFWEIACRGGYPGHAEVLLTDEHVMWWNKGGELRGESVERIAFLKQLMQSGPARGIDPHAVGNQKPIGAKGGDWLLGYTGVRQPVEWPVANLPAGRRYRLEHIDPWAMTIREVETPIVADDQGRALLPMPGRPHQAFRLTTAD